MDQRQEDTLRGAVRDTGTLPTESEQAEPAGPPRADLIPTGTVTLAATRGVEPGAGATRSDVERDVSSEESRAPDSETPP